ncbi:hypothetical protein N8940_02355 [Sphingomonadaceae bacterium]|nr:hypothetical protein [Sphingomonadaceae bacterium]
MPTGIRLYAERGAAEAPVAPEKLMLAEQIIDEAFPVEAREGMFKQLSDQLNAQMLESVSTQIDDEGAFEILRNWQQAASE